MLWVLSPHMHMSAFLQTRENSNLSKKDFRETVRSVMNLYYPKGVKLLKRPDSPIFVRVIVVALTKMGGSGPIVNLVLLHNKDSLLTRLLARKSFFDCLHRENVKSDITQTSSLAEIKK